MTSVRGWIVLLLFAALLLAFGGQAHSIIWWVTLAPVLFFCGLIALHEEIPELQPATLLSPFRFAIPARAPPLS